ncbi:MAG: PhoPQ-activated pathogenicity-related family protein [Armatimonadetes bacterium]|nr:PhoPQ-activated pathogenicity-related family protein [Armatimonadota bacterium]
MTKAAGAVICFALGLATCAPAAADLFSYLAKPDDSFAWELRSVEELPQGKVYDIHLVSQVWQGITWEHQVQVYEPANVAYPDVMAMLITGGRAGQESRTLGLMAANMSGTRFATLYNIPNQPLFGGLTEDALISHTWVKYLETGDEDWILLFPMVKSAIRAMDCLEKLAAERWNQKLRGFVVTGASKRGWTTYLTGIADPVRVLAIAPMVFDILNMPVSARHHLDFWGFYSPMIDDYTEKGLEALVDTPRGSRLFFIVDPYSYRYRLTMPKLVILGSNDPYWPVDAVTLYWPGLPPLKYLLIAPNSGHGLDDRVRVLTSLTSFAKLVATGGPWPQVQWRWSDKQNGSELQIVCTPRAAEAKLWVARDKVRDFRQAQWAEQSVQVGDDAIVAQVDAAPGQWTAAYGEVALDMPQGRLVLSTEPRVIAPKTGD